MGDRLLDEPLFQHAIKMFGVSISDLERWLKTRLVQADIQFEIKQAPTDVDIILSSKEKAFLDASVAVMEKEWGRFCYSTQAEPVEEIVGKYLLLSGYTIAVAESCTGGRIASRLTSVPGSSRYFDSACVCYSNRSKVRQLSIPMSLIEEKGAVSREVASAMAEGVRIGAKSDFGLAVTGIAGPEGGSEEKPLGLVYVAVSDENHTRSSEYRFGGDRDAVQSAAAQTALEILRHTLVERLKEPPNKS